MKTIHFMCHVPGEVYAVDVYALSEKDAREQVRERFGLRRLPAGTAFWKAN